MNTANACSFASGCYSTSFYQNLIVMNQVASFLSFKDYETLTQAFPVTQMFREWKLKQKESCKKIKAFFKFLQADIKIKKAFIQKLFSDRSYRRKYLYIHNEPSPHICLKISPPYYLRRGIKRFDGYKHYFENPSFEDLQSFLSTKPVHTWQYYLFVCDDILSMF